MADKQPILRQMFRRGRNKSPADDTTDSNSDGSCLMADFNTNNDRLSPALPVARPPSLSPNARVPRKLQKKRSNIDTSASLTSPASSWEQRDKSSAQEPTEREMNAPSRRDIRRAERRQPEPTTATIIRTKKDMAVTSADPKPIPHKKESDSLSSRKTGKISKILGVNYSDQKSHLSAQLPDEDSSYESSDLESLGTLSPMSTKSEPAMSDKKFVDASERRKSIGLAVDTKRFSTENPDYLDPDTRGRRRMRRSSRIREKRRTPSPVSPVRDSGVRPDDSPISPLSDTSKDAFANRDAPLLPHERMVSTDTSTTPPSVEKISESSNHSGRSSPSSTPREPQRTKLQKKSKIPTPKTTIVSKDKDDSHHHDSSSTYHDSAAARAALMKTLQDINTQKHSTTEERNAVARRVLREAHTVLDFGPREPVVPAAPDPPPPPSPLVPRMPGRGMRTLQSQVYGPVGSERVAHPTKVQYDQPLMLQGGIMQRGFRRWRCCRCQCFTHYENNVCSKLDCVHVRCEALCEAFEP